MIELQKQLAICINIVDQTVQIINQPFIEGTTWGGEKVYQANPNRVPVETLLKNLKNLLTMLKSYDEKLHNRLENNIKTLVDLNGKLNPYQFGGVIQILGIINDGIAKDTPQFKSDTVKPMKLFISHSEKDKIIVGEFVDLLTRIGFTPENLFCSSFTGYDIPVGSGDIFEYLKNEFESNNLFVVFMLSKNYYNSAACLNEMGAAWVKSCTNQSILLPDFKFRSIKGAISPRDIGFVINNQYRLTEFKDLLAETFGLSAVSTVLWQKYQNEFLSKITNKTV